MITKMLYDCKGIKAGSPIAFVEFLSGDRVLVKVAGGEQIAVPASAVDAHEPEESLPALSEKMGVPYDTLVKYARDGKILARKSGGVWLSTARAIEAAGIKPR